MVSSWLVQAAHAAEPAEHMGGFIGAPSPGGVHSRGFGHVGAG